jgi:hypothetical protein
MATAPQAINCPRCAQPLVYVTSKGTAVHVYACPEHGEYVLFSENGDSFLSSLGTREYADRADSTRR